MTARDHASGGGWVDQVIASAMTVRGWLRRSRRSLLTTGGFGFITAAAWTLALPLGLLTAGLALLVLEHLTSPEEDPPQ